MIYTRYYIDDRGVRASARYVGRALQMYLRQFFKIFARAYHQRVKEVVYREKKQLWLKGLSSPNPAGQSHLRRIRESRGFRAKIYHAYLKTAVDWNEATLYLGSAKTLGAIMSPMYRGRAFPIWWIYEFGTGIYGAKHTPIIVRSHSKPMVFYWNDEWIAAKLVERKGIGKEKVGTVFNDRSKLPMIPYGVSREDRLASAKYTHSFLVLHRKLKKMFNRASWFRG